MIVKGVKGFDYERAYEAMKTTAMNENYDCLPEYREKGYVPLIKKQNLYPKHWNMLTMIIVSHRQPKHWGKWKIIIIS